MKREGGVHAGRPPFIDTLNLMPPISSQNEPGERRFPRPCRVRRPADFRQAYAGRCSASDHRLVVIGRENGLPHCRLGLSVSRKVGGAVSRNRWKRLLREAFRLSRHHLPAGVDLIVIPRLGVPPELAGLMESLPRLAARVEKRLAGTSR